MNKYEDWNFQNFKNFMSILNYWVYFSFYVHNVNMNTSIVELVDHITKKN